MSCREHEKQLLHIADKQVTLYQSAQAEAPILYLNTFEGEGDRIFDLLQNSSDKAFTLAAISGLAWNHDMAPWNTPPVFAKDTPCTGGADAYLQLLTEVILPETEARIAGKPTWRGLAGYSLAGLFAVYALYQTDVFSKVASVSGSLWFPNFCEYIAAHEMKVRPSCLYFSLGDREHRTKNHYLHTVRQNTERIAAFYAEKGIDTILQFNPGNHFQHTAERTAAGLLWLLNR